MFYSKFGLTSRAALEHDLMEDDLVKLVNVVHKEFVITDHLPQNVQVRLFRRVLAAHGNHVVVNLSEALRAKLLSNYRFVAFPLRNDGSPAVDRKLLFLLLDLLFL